MKISTSRAITTLLICAPLFFYSCKKDAVSNNPNVLPISSDKISDADAPGIYRTTTGNTKLVLQPGDDGQDAWIDWFNGYDSATYNNGNAGSIAELKCLAWTMLDGFVKSRTLISFTGLTEIPSTSQIKEAKLFLYGLTESSANLPQGNSYYPNSPYKDFGPNDIYVQRIISQWNENSVTWNNQPSTTVIGESLISPSTKQWNYNTSVDVTKIVKSLVKSPSENYGFMLSLTNENIYRSMGFYSSEYNTAAQRPKLIVTYK